MTAITSTVTPSASTIRDPKTRRALVAPVGFRRPNDATAYIAGDVVSNLSGAARALEFANCASRKGGSGVIHRATLSAGMTSVSSYSLLLFSDEPTNYADNAALALAEADRRILLGHFLLASPQGLGGTRGHYSSGGQVGFTTESPISFVCASTSASIWGLLITGAGGTPVADSEFVITLHGEQDIG